MSEGRTYDSEMVIETFYSKLDQIAVMWGVHMGHSLRL